MRVDLSVKEIINLAHVISKLPNTTIGKQEKSSELSEILQDEVYYDKEPGFFKIEVRERDELGMTVRMCDYYNGGILKEMENYNVALAYAVSSVFNGEMDRKYCEVLTELLGYSIYGGGCYGVVDIEQYDDSIDSRRIRVNKSTTTMYTVEQFLEGYMNI